MGKFVSKSAKEMVNLRGGGNDKFQREPSLMDKIRTDGKLFDYRSQPDGTVVRLRLVGNLMPAKVHWVKTIDGKKQFPVYCTKFNPEDELPTMPYDKLDEKGNVIGTSPSDEYRCIFCALGMKPTKNYFMNCIDREYQLKHGGIGEESAENWEGKTDTPIRLVQMGHGILQGLKNTCNLFEGTPPNSAKRGYEMAIIKSTKGDTVAEYTMREAPNSQKYGECQRPLEDYEKEWELFDVEKIMESIIQPIEENLITAFRCRTEGLELERAIKILEHYRNLKAITQVKFDSVLDVLNKVNAKHTEYDSKNGKVSVTKPSDDDEETDVFKASSKYNEFDLDDDEEPKKKSKKDKKKKYEDDDDE